jgi:hypothetical protein
MHRNPKSRLLLSALLLGGFVLGLAFEEASAIPAFARKYKFSCTTCHAPAPRLKDFGTDFADNGFQLPDGEEPKRAYRDTGDEFLTLQTDLPLAVRFDAYLGYEDYDGEDAISDFKTPWGMKLLSGGNIAPDVGYYFYFYMSERGEVAGLEDAYVHFNDLGGIPLDVLVGQFQICDPMMKRELKLTVEDYDVYRVTPGYSGANLTYDRGVLVSWAAPFGIGLIGQVVNGNGKPEAGEDRTYDNDQDKGYAGRATWGWGPVGIGGFYYTTVENIQDQFDNDVEIFGPDATIAFGEVAFFTGQYLYRTDSRPLDAADEVETQGIVAELVVQPWGPDAKDHFVLLYNWIDSDLEPADFAMEDFDDADREAWTLSWSHLHRRNLRMVAEGTWDVEREGLRAFVGFSSAF